MNIYANKFLKTRLKTRQLLLLAAIADEKNIHKAANSLNMTQPAASKLLKDLEDALNVELFERNVRGMLPTIYGETMVRNARIALNTLSTAHDELQALAMGVSGTVKIGSIASPGISMVPEVISSVKEISPRLRIHLDITTSDVLIEKLSRGELDMALCRLSASDDKSVFNYETIGEESVSIIAKVGHALTNQRSLDLAQLMNESWVLSPKGSAIRMGFDKLLQTMNLSLPSFLIECSSLLFTTKMLQVSNMIAMVSSEVANYYQANKMVSILPIEIPGNMDFFGLVTRKDFILSPAAEFVREYLRASIQRNYSTEPA